MLQVAAPDLHWRLSARFHAASDARISFARWMIFRSSADGATSAAVSTRKLNAESCAARSDTGYQPSKVRITPGPEAYVSTSTESPCAASAATLCSATRFSSSRKNVWTSANDVAGSLL